MPSRNKKNKNRSQPASGVGATATKNEITSVKISENLGSNESQSKFTITEAKEKLDQLQQSVDSIKMNISQAKVTSSDAQSSEQQLDATTEKSIQEESNEQPFETQTMKKKRNRNRNRNRNKNNVQSIDESSMINASETNVNCTHENSPTPVALAVNILPISEIITSEIKDESIKTQTETVKAEVKNESMIENAVELSKSTECTVRKEDPCDSQPIESEIRADECNVTIEEISTEELIVEQPITVEPAEKCEPMSKENDKRVKDNNQKKKAKNANKNQKEKPTDAQTKKEDIIEKKKVDVVVSLKNDEIKCDTNDQFTEMDKNDAHTKKEDTNESKNKDDIANDQLTKMDKNEKIDKKDDKTQVKIVDTKNIDSKTVKENKKSPRMNKKASANNSNPVGMQQKLVEQCELTNVPTKSNDGILEKKKNENEMMPLENVKKAEITSNESKQPAKIDTNTKVTCDEPSTIDKKSTEKQVKNAADKNQSENTQKRSSKQDAKSDRQKTVDQKVAAKKDTEIIELKVENKALKEIKEEPKQETESENKNENDQQENKQECKEQSPIETKTVTPDQSGSLKESKKQKGKKSQPQQSKVQNVPKIDSPNSIIVESEAQSKMNMESCVEKKNELHSLTESPETAVPPEVIVETVVQEKLVEKNVPTADITEPKNMEAKNMEPKITESKITEPKSTEPKITEPKITLEPSNPEASTKKETPSTTDVQSKIETEPKKSELSVTTGSDEVTKTPSTTPVLSTPAPETSTKSAQQEDETSKILKILEEASKSLEPVEIEMGNRAVPTIASQPIEATSILCSTKDNQDANQETEELMTLPKTKDDVKSGQKSVQPKAAPIKGNNQQAKQNSPTKTIDNQPKKGVDSKKKDMVKPQQKNAKVTKSAQSRSSSTPEKAPDKILEPSTRKKTPENAPPIEESASVAVEEIPLDVSIMPNEIEVAELNTDSKNVQGSDFVPSVEQSTAEAKSLEPKTEQIQNGKKSKSKSPVNLIEEKTSHSQPSTGEIEKETKGSMNENVENVENFEQSVELKKLEVTNLVSASKSPSKSVSLEKSKQNNAQNANKSKDVKNVLGKPMQNNKKSNGKPAVPPKPDNLVSGNQVKRAHADAKSESAVKSKTEKILILTGHNEDDDSEDDYIEYKFMPRQVFIATICQLCKKPTMASERILCQHCQMVSYCSAEHAQNDELHKDLCAAIQEIAKKRGGHIYNNARILNNNDFRSLRVHTLNLCENFLKRPLQTFEREILLFPRLCSTPTCREWRQNQLTDCPNCGQVFYCTNQPEHFIESHQRWCKSIALYQKIVVTQSVSGRIEPKLPSRIQTKPYILPNTIGDVFKDLYKNYSAIKDDCVFATLTQLATAPLTAYFATQKCEKQIGEKFTIHLIGAELQFEADVLDIWETFFLHLAHNLMELTIVFCGPELNAENIPLDIISRIRMCRSCRQSCRIVKFDFQCAKLYHDYATSSTYTKPDLICFFNPGFHHVNSLNGMDTWSETIKIASSSSCPVVVTSYSEFESPRDLDRFQAESTNGGKQMTLVYGPELNAYASQRPERNFISDEIVPLIFKNYFCFIMK